MVVEIVRTCPGEGDAGDEGLIRRCAETVTAHLGIATPMAVTIMLTDDANIREINRQTRKIDASTDVLSFPLLEISPGDPAGIIETGQEDTDPETGAVLLGDIVISLDAVERQAHEYGHRRERELGYLTVHGMLHLLGYDHMAEEDKTRMRLVEDQVMERLGLAR